ncbi:MAG TPA: plasmid stabilization protein [Geminicoccaceae bacterium]|nr:plasmid stabilization protein [Geminicoccus sp.]HMU49359.1 plasmid stabilization protein [Geminicoccaceae bacterium]
MAQLTIRNLDDRILSALRQRAAAAGHSMEQEARDILASATRPDKAQIIERLRARRAAFGDRVFDDSAELVRQMRDERSELR